MKANKWVAVLATGLVLAVAAPVSAQFGGLGSLKKKLETVAKELEKPKPAPPQSRSATSQGGYATPTQTSQPQPTTPPAPTVATTARDDDMPVQQEEAGSEPQIIGQRAPANLQLGVMPAVVKSGLMKVDSCVYFEDGQGQGSSVVEFVNYEGAIDTVVISDKSIFKNVGIEDLNLKSGVEYLGATATDYYIKITLVQDKPISIIGKAWKQNFSNDPAINFDFGNKRTGICYLEANNIG